MFETVKRRLATAAACLLALCCMAAPATAETFPDRPITLIDL